MKLTSLFLIAVFVGFGPTTCSVYAQAATHVVISEVSPMRGNSSTFNKGEFIELYNPLQTDVTFGPNVQIISGKTPPGTNNAEWQVSLSGKTIKAFGFFLIGDGGVTTTPDVPFPSSKNLSNSGVRSCVQLRDGETIIDAFGWDPGVTLQLAPEGIAFSPSSTSTAASVSFERKSGPTATADDSLGNAWDTNNNAADFFENLAANTIAHNSSSPVEVNPYSVLGGGIGSAEIAPSIVSSSTTSDFVIKLAGDVSGVIDTVVVIVPSNFTWPMNASSASLGGGGVSNAKISVLQDTICIGGTAITKTDTGEIVIHSVTVPDSATTGNFIVKTGLAGVTPSPIISQLIVSVTKLVRIIDLHVNDAQGVPAAPYQEGVTVTVSGIITADMSTSAYTSLFLQDATAGINIYSNSPFHSCQVGDSVTFTGTIDQYRGTTEIVPDSAKTVISSHGNPLPEPMALTAADVNQTFMDDNTEPNEGRLVRVNGVNYTGNNTVADATGTTGTFIPTTINVPSGTFDLIGILKQYKPGTASTLTPPYTANYEVDPRTQADVIIHPGPAYVEAPAEEDIEPNSVTIHFKTGAPSNAVVRYGATSAYTDSIVVSSPDTVHSIALAGLWPATVYHYQVSATDPAGTNQTSDAIFSTASPAGTTGIINVYFSKTVDTTVARGENAQTVDISSKFISRINGAQHSIDVALYSLSGTVGSNVASALINAKNRGVKVRMIVENDNSNTAPMNTMKSSGIPFITDTFDPINAGNGLMHNKFAVLDFRDTSSFTDDWVWTGSWNATDPGNNSDAQNSIEIQDKALANAYTMDFDEMWGSSTDTPNSALSRFGIRKTDNTPHSFNVNGTPVELYFSPSDQTTLHIYETLGKATSSINVCMLTFTRDDLAQVLVAKKAAGEKVRVVMDNDTDTGNQFSFLLDSGVDVHLKGSALGTGLLHHKYALIDAENPNADDIVITGSHNWSTAAETANDENTLMIHSKRIANLYLQEFKARYIEAGGTDTITTAVRRAATELPTIIGLSQNYPNPFNPTTVISYQLSADSYVKLKIYDILGREIATLVSGEQRAGYYNATFNAVNLASGTYFYMLSADRKMFVKKMLLIK